MDPDTCNILQHNKRFCQCVGIFFCWGSTEMKLSTEKVSLGYARKSVNNAAKQTHKAKPTEKADTSSR